MELLTRRIGRRAGTLAHRGAVLLVVGFFVLPFYIMLTNALKPEVHINASPPVFVFRPTLDHFVEVFRRYPFVSYMVNSAVISVSATLFGFLIGVPAAYAIARYDLRRVLTTFLAVRMIPYVSLLIPWYLMAQRTETVDTYPPMILTHLVFTVPYAAMILVGFFEDIPRALEEAAWIDGCSRMGAFVRIALPLTLPGIVAAAVIAFTYSWNNFLFALVLTGARTKTLPIAVYGFMSSDHMDWGGLSAAATLITAPVLVFVFFVQRHLVRGLVAGAVK
ncbi:MAG TPA: carbohydrate ABC transporter permease [Methylomirabilota bacterium]|nr:carbohydrate ABC transporter permease [Methylomirabilota bacterium]